MIDANRLAKEQPVVYQVLKNGLEQNKLAHAYLFVGANGTPTLETAYLLAQSILCEEDLGYACGHCVICKRVQENKYADLIVLDGSVSSIKKEQIMKLQEQFNKTGLEKYGKKIYIINQIENTSPEALNGLLKFLEEPSGNQLYAILITSKVDRLLDTIISRCQNINFRPIAMEECVSRAIALGVEEEDAQILSKLIKDPDRINEVSLEESFQKNKTYTMEVVEALIGQGWEAAYVMQRRLKDDKKFDKDSFAWVVDLMIVFFQEAIVASFVSPQPKWNALVTQASGLNQVPMALQALLETKDALQRYPNLNLLVDQLFYKLIKGVS